QGRVEVGEDQVPTQHPVEALVGLAEANVLLPELDRGAEPCSHLQLVSHGHERLLAQIVEEFLERARLIDAGGGARENHRVEDASVSIVRDQLQNSACGNMWPGGGDLVERLRMRPPGNQTVD